MLEPLVLSRFFNVLCSSAETAIYTILFSTIAHPRSPIAYGLHQSSLSFKHGMAKIPHLFLFELIGRLPLQFLLMFPNNQIQGGVTTASFIPFRAFYLLQRPCEALAILSPVRLLEGLAVFPFRES
jgi:hypothetical protein